MQLYQGQCVGGIYEVHFYNSCCSECYADTSNNSKTLLTFPFLVGICSITSSQQPRHSGPIEDCKEKSCSGWKGEDPVFQQNETRREVYLSVFCPNPQPTFSGISLFSFSETWADPIPFPFEIMIFSVQSFKVMMPPCPFYPFPFPHVYLSSTAKIKFV